MVLNRLAKSSRIHIVTGISKGFCGRRASKTFDIRPKDLTPKDWKGSMANGADAYDGNI